MQLLHLHRLAVMVGAWLLLCPAVTGQSDIRRMQERNIERHETQLEGWDREIQKINKRSRELVSTRSEVAALCRQAEALTRAASELRSQAEGELRTLETQLEEFDRAEKAFHATREKAVAMASPSRSSVSAELGRMQTALDAATAAWKTLAEINPQLDSLATNPDSRSGAATVEPRLSQALKNLEGLREAAEKDLLATRSIEAGLDRLRSQLRQELEGLELSRGSATEGHEQQRLDKLISRTRIAIQEVDALFQISRQLQRNVGVGPLEGSQKAKLPEFQEIDRGRDALLDVQKLSRGSVGTSRADLAGARKRMDLARKSADLLQSPAPGAAPSSPSSPSSSSSGGAGATTGGGAGSSGSPLAPGAGQPAASPSAGGGGHPAAPTAPDHHGGLQITPQVRRIRVGEAVQLRAVDHGGRVYSGAVWSGSNTRALAVSGNGLIIGRVAGDGAMIMVRVEDMGAILEVEVVAAEDTSAAAGQPPAGAPGGQSGGPPGGASTGQGGGPPSAAPGGQGSGQPDGTTVGPGGGQPGGAAGSSGGTTATDTTPGGEGAEPASTASGGDDSGAGSASSGAESGESSAPTGPGAAGSGPADGSGVSLLGTGTSSGEPGADGSAGPGGADAGGDTPGTGATGQTPDDFLTSDLPDPDVSGTAGDGNGSGDGAAERAGPVELPTSGDGTPAVSGVSGEAADSGEDMAGGGETSGEASGAAAGPSSGTSDWATDWQTEPVEVTGGGTASGANPSGAEGASSGSAAADIAAGSEAPDDTMAPGGGDAGWGADWQGEPMVVSGGDEGASGASAGDTEAAGGGDSGWAADWQAEPVEVADGGGAASDADAVGSGGASGGGSTGSGDSGWGADWQAEPVEVAAGDDSPGGGLELLGEESQSVAAPPASPARPPGDPLAGDWMESVRAECLEESASRFAGGTCREFFSQMKAAGCYLDAAKGNFMATDWTPRFADSATQVKVRSCRLKSVRLVRPRPEHHTQTKGVVRILRTGSGYSGRSLEDYGSPEYGMIQQKGAFWKEGTLGPGTQVMRGLRKASGHDYYMGECLVAHDFTALPRFWTRCRLEIVAEGRALLGLFWRPELYWVNVKDRQSWARAGTSRPARVVGLVRIRAGQLGSAGSSTTAASGAGTSRSGDCWVGCRPGVRPLRCAVACDGQFSATTALANGGHTDYRLKNASWEQCAARMRELGQQGW